MMFSSGVSFGSYAPNLTNSGLGSHGRSPRSSARSVGISWLFPAVVMESGAEFLSSIGFADKVYPCPPAENYCAATEF